MRLQLRGRLAVETAQGPVLTEVGADLLEQIDAIGSLTESAKRLRISYRHAWSLVEAMNRRCGTPVVSLRAGGRQGGGAQLTESGASLLRCFRLIQAQVQLVLDEHEPLLARALRSASTPSR